MKDDKLYALESPEQGGEILRALQERFRAVPERGEERYTCLDSPDGRLLAAGWELRSDRSNGTLDLELREIQGRALQHARLTGTDAREPQFVWDLDATPLRGALEPVLEVRRLLPQVQVHRRAEGLRLLDEQQKTVGLVAVERLAGAPPGAERVVPVGLFLRLRPVRGYAEVERDVARWLEEEHGLRPVGQSELDLVLAAAGIEPPRDRSSIAPEIEPGMLAEQAARRVLAALLQVIRANEEGVRTALDTEFLHDFRVAVRRSRVVLSRLRGVFGEAEVKTLRAELRWLQTVTGPTRDLDVHLLEIPRYRLSLPAQAARALAPLEALLTRQQRAAHRALVRHLGSRRYRALLQDFSALVDAPAAGPDAARPAREVLARHIREAYRKLLSAGRRIDAASPDADLHRLRLLGKKLRYLMELFAPLFTEGGSANVQALRRLQNCLGDFNDHRFQRAALETFAADLAARRRGLAETQRAIGRLLEQIEERQQAARAELAARFAQFDTPKNREGFRGVYGCAAEVQA